MPPAKGSKGKRTASNSAGTLTPEQQKRYALLSAIGRSSAFRSRMAGTQFAGKRDIYAAAGYHGHGAVTFDDYFGLYTRGDIAGRIVDMPAKTTWRQPPEITEPEADEKGSERKDAADKTKFTEAFNTLAKRLRLWEYVTRVDQLAGIGRYAVLFIGVKGADDATLKQELTAVKGPDDLIYLSVYHEKHAKVSEWELDPGSPRFGMPKLYELTVVSPEAVGGGNVSAKPKLIVHASRVIHVAENLLDDDVYGRPRLERALNRLMDLEKVAASTGESYWQLTSKILQAKIDPEAEISEAQFKELDEKLGELVHDLKRQFYGQGVNLEWLSSETPNVDQVADFYFSLIAGASGIPKRILFGSELGELASTTDEATYFGSIEERRVQFANSQIIRPLLDRLIGIKALPKPSSGEYSIVWAPLNVESPKQKADASLVRAQTAQALTAIGGNPRDLVYIDENGEVWLKTDGEDDLELGGGDYDDDDELDGLEDALVRSAGPGQPLPVGETTEPFGGLNGAQVTSIVKLVEQVGAGTLPKSSAMAIIAASFPDLTPEQVEAIFRDIAEGKMPPADGDGGDGTEGGSSTGA